MSMPALAEHFHVIAPDLRGMGDSSRPLTGYDARTVGGDVIQLMDQLGVETFGLVGHDIGAIVAYALAAHWRDRVTRFAFLDALLPGFSLEEQSRLPPHGRALWHMNFHASPMGEFLVSGRERAYLTWFFRTIAYAPDAVPADHVDAYVTACSQPGALRGGFAHYAALAEDVHLNRETGKEPLAIPVLALGGSASLGTLVADEMRMVATDVTGDVVPECGHWIPEEQPAWLVERLLSFFEAGGDR
jgi:pimeloyl-ACP methyl ester carboxylesterase